MRLLALVLVTSLLVLNGTSASAAKIKSVKGKRAVVDMESDSYSANQVLSIVNSSGKTVGIFKVVKVKGTTAEGMYKGKAQPGFALKPRPKKSKKSSTAKKRRGPTGIN